jgi:hypothetical protein
MLGGRRRENDETHRGRAFGHSDFVIPSSLDIRHSSLLGEDLEIRG